MTRVDRALVALGAVLAACEPPTADCGDGAREAGVLCFPKEDVLHVGQGFLPGAMAALDVDGDGALDLAAANPERQTLSITWGGPGPTLERMTSWAVGRPLAGLAHGDFDGDGHLDLATALPDDDAVAVLRGRGGRRFALTLYAAGSSPSAALGVDLDGDGRAELLTANLGDGSVSVLRRGVADPPVIVGAGPHALAAGDLDGDGALDVAVALADEDAVQVLTGAGGALLPGARHGVGFAPRALVAADLDGDGAVDLASADELGETVTVVRGDGAGGALETRTWPVMPLPSGLVLVRDGASLPGLGVMSEQTSELWLLDPRSGAGARGGSEDWAAALAAGDLDGDGREELVVGGRGGAAGALVPAEGLRFAAEWRAPAVRTFAPVDLDGDGREALVVALDDSGDLAVWRGPADVAGVERLATGLKDGVEGLSGADMNADGRADLVVWGRTGSGTGQAIVVLVQQFDGSFDVGGPPLELAGADIGELRSGDVGGDGTTDLVFVDGTLYAGLDGLWVVTGDGLGGLVAAEQVDPRVPVAWTTLDLDGDAALDVAAIYTELELYADLGVGRPLRFIDLVALPTAVAAGDVDGDDDDDLMVCDTLGVALRRDIGGIPAPAVRVADVRCGTLELRDVDDDGDLDALLQVTEAQRSSLSTISPVRDLLTVLVNDGAGGFTVAARQAFAGAGAGVRVVGRGVEGLAVAVAGDAGLDVLRAEVGPVLVERPLAALGAGVSPEFGDLDGDGVVDWFGGSGEQLVAGFGAGGGAFGPAYHAALAGLVDADVVALASLALADLDGDGADEAVALGVIDNPTLSLRALTVLRVDADGGFVGEPIARLVSENAGLAVRDLDGDAHPDLLVVEGAVDGLKLTRLRGRGDGSFEDAVTQGLSGVRYMHGFVEVDGDRHLDLLLQMPGGLAVARGQSGGFEAPRVWWVGEALTLRVRDLTGDHRPDLLFNSRSQNLVLLTGDGAGFGAPRVLREETALASLEIADLDGDGGEELLLASVGVEGTTDLQVGRPVGDGRFVFSGRRVPTPGTYFGASVGLEARDLDGDAAPDVVLSTPGGFSIVRQLP